MIYIDNPIDAELVRKVNRFLCVVKINGRNHDAHIPNSGRLTELMTPGRKCLVEKAKNPDRKTRYTLKSVWYNRRWVCIDSNVPNKLMAELFEKRKVEGFEGYTEIKREHTVGKHRFDFLLNGQGQKPALVEVKSVTLVEKGVARFPDAPTERGASHLRTLTKLTKEGYRCAVVFVIQRSDAKSFQPNDATDPAFGEALREAERAGVEMMVVKCKIGVNLIKRVKVKKFL